MLFSQSSAPDTAASNAPQAPIPFLHRVPPPTLRGERNETSTGSIRTADAGSSRCSGLARAWTDVRRCMPQSRSFWLILVVNRQINVELLSCRADNALWRLVAEATYHRAWTFVSACRCRAVKGIAVEWAKERSSREFPQETHDRLPLVGQAQHLQQVRLVSTDDRTIATSPRDKWRLLSTFVSTMRCRSR